MTTHSPSRLETAVESGTPEVSDFNPRSPGSDTALIHSITDDNGTASSFRQASDLLRKFGNIAQAAGGDHLPPLGLFDPKNSDILIAQSSHRPLGASLSDATGGALISPERLQRVKPEQRDAGLPITDGTADPSVAGDLPKHHEDYRKRYGVRLEVKDGKFQVGYQADGRRQQIPGTENIPATADGLKELTTVLDKHVQDKISQLQKDYGIEIRKPGAFLGNQQEQCGPHANREKPPDPKAQSAIKTRNPTIAELTSLESALKSVADVDKGLLGTADRRPLIFSFADKAPVVQNGAPAPIGGEYKAPDQNQFNRGRAEIIMFPAPSDVDVPVTDKDAKEKGLLPLQSNAATVRHEIGHHVEHRAHREGIYPRQTLENIGFRAVINRFNSREMPGLTTDAVKVGSTDNPSYFVKLPDTCNNPEPRWMQVDTQGRALGADGKPVNTPNRTLPPAGANVVSNDYIRDNLVVPSPTPYFDNINEGMSEAFSMYTGGEVSRLELQQKHPKYFEEVRRLIESRKAKR